MTADMLRIVLLLPVLFVGLPLLVGALVKRS
jgi:hypothetical protein